MTTVVVRTEVCVQNETKKITIRVLDDDAQLVAANNVELRIYSDSETVMVYDNFDDGYGSTPALPTHIENPSVGVYKFPFGDTSFDSSNSSEDAGLYIARWIVTDADDEERVETQSIRVIPLLQGHYMSELKERIDKAAKRIDDAAAAPCFVGYTDDMLVSFLEGGLSWINAFQPYPTWSTIESFPETDWRILIEAAFFDALIAQEVFAVDTDINYSDQGNVFMIDHQAKLASIISASWQRLQYIVPLFKRKYVTSGALRVEYSGDQKFMTLVQSTPRGNLFRGSVIS